jgi:5-methylcytosine-specific restriction protein A
LYDSPAWKALRAAVLAAHPWCGCGARTTEVDHVRAVRDGGAPLDEANLEALCKPCHSRKTLRENR